MKQQDPAIRTVGRFAPSPTGPLHLGSLVAALGSWLSARKAGGRWLVRMEDLDAPRVVPGAADEILASLRAFGLERDGEVVFQSGRSHLYESALARLRAGGLVFDCGCSRRELQQAASAPAEGDPTDSGGAAYPGTCRNGLAPGKTPRAVRFRVPPEPIRFHDAMHGEIEEHLCESVGDFVVRRADGPFAYQLAVVVDDAEQGVTEVVRGGDLLSSTARQIALQKALGEPTPRYAHLPLVVDAEGRKLGKRTGALPLPALRPSLIARALSEALAILGVPDVEPAMPRAMLEEGLRQFDFANVPRASAGKSGTV